MKSVLQIDTVRQAAHKEYPYLGKYEDGSFVVLFITPRHGSVVWQASGEDTYELGSFHSSWEEHTFKRLPDHEEVRLSNEEG